MTKSSTPKELYLVIALTVSERLSYHSSILSQVISKEHLSLKIKKEKKKKPQANNIKINPQKSTGKEEREEMRERKREIEIDGGGEGKKRERREKLPACKGDSRRMWNYSIDEILTCMQLNSIKRESI